MTVLILIVWKLLLTREEAAEMLGISLRKLDEQVAEGKLKTRRIDNCVRFYIGDLIEFASWRSDKPDSDEQAPEVSNDHAA